MAFVKGSSVNFGLAPEGTRGTYSEPTAWIPARTPNGIMVTTEKYVIEETNLSGVDSSGSEIVQTGAEGDLEFNVRNATIGHIVKTLLGIEATSSVETGVTKHTYTVDPSDPQKPALSLALAQENGQDYQYTTGVAGSLEFRTPLESLVNATASFTATKEATHADFTPAFADDDYYFRQHDVTIKFANDVSGLSGASAIALKEMTTTIEDTNMRKNQTIGNLASDDVLSDRVAVSGNFVADYTNTDHHDTFATGGYKAVEIEMVRTDVTIGASSNPTIKITLPKVSFEGYESDRPLDDILKDNVDFKAHYDADEASAITVEVINEES